MIVPVAFVSEHSETLVELDIEYRHLAEANGAACYVRAPTVQAAPPFIDGLARLARFAVLQERGSFSGSQAEEPTAGECSIHCNRCARRQIRWAGQRRLLSPPGLNRPVDFGVADPAIESAPGYGDTPGALGEAIVSYPGVAGSIKQ